MAKQSLVFEAVADPVSVLGEDGRTTVVSGEVIEFPIAIHESDDFVSGERSVTHIPSRRAFRRQMTLSAAQALRAALIAGIPGSWLLDWTDPEDMAAAEEANLTTLLASHPDNYFGSADVTAVFGAPPGELWLCPAAPGLPSYNAVSDGSGQFIFTGVVPGAYDVYGFNTPDGAWSNPPAPVTVLLNNTVIVTGLAVAAPAPHAIPCKP